MQLASRRKHLPREATFLRCRGGKYFAISDLFPFNKASRFHNGLCSNYSGGNMPGMTYADSGVEDCDILGPIQKPKWKCWLIRW